jgi:hypothetical protein
MDDNFDARGFIEGYFARMWDLTQAGVEALVKWAENPLATRQLVDA